MMKRRNPYSDDFVPQLKIHIGLKQANINNEDKMKAVYDKTIGMLFEAANKKHLDYTWNIMSNLHNHHDAELPLGGRKQLKQTFFGKNGSLQKNGHAISDVPNVQQCSICSLQPSDPWESCTYCESPQCGSCSTVCINCNKQTCANCSFPTYNNMDSVLCVSCSR